MSARGKPVVTSSRKRFRVQKSAKIVPIEESPTKREISPAKTEKGVEIDDMERTTRAVGPVYDAGGGSGFEGLTFDNLKEEQENMYMRTLSTTVLEDANVEQELRQLEIADEYITYIVNISREDFPSKSADLEVRFTPKALQAAWAQFLVDARVALDVEFVDTIVDRKDGAPVNRMLGLRNGGQYFLRQREASAIMEVIQSGALPEQVSWKVTSGINIAKDKLKESTKYQNEIDDKIDFIINQPMLREQQREATYMILEAENVKEIIDAMWEVMNSHDLPPEEYAIAMEAKMKHENELKKKEEERQERLAHLVAVGGDPKEILRLSQGANISSGEDEGFGGISTKTYDAEVDIVSLFRLSFETITRLANRSQDDIPDIANAVIDFMEQTISKYRHEVDIVVLGSATLSNLVEGMIPHRKRAYHLLMDNIQAYAPPNDSFRPSRVVRRLLDPIEAMRQEEEWEKQFDPDHIDEAEAELNKSQSQILDQVREVGGEEKFDLEAYMKELEEKKKAEEEAERARLAALEAAQAEESESEEEEEDLGPKMNKGKFSGTVGYIGKLKPEEVQYASIYDDAPDDGKKKKKLLKGFKPFAGARPLPEVPGIMFRGLVGPYKSDMAMLQCFSSLYAFIQTSYGNRQEAFELSIQEEAATIGLVCIGNPRLLEYCLWIIDCMYMDGFMVDQDEESTLAATGNISELDGNTTIASGSGMPSTNQGENQATLSPVREGVEGIPEGVQREKNLEGGGGDGDDGSSLGMEIDLASTITMPSVDLEGKNRLLKENIEVNIGDPTEDYDDAFPNVDYMPVKKEGADLTEIVVDGEEKERQAREKKKEAMQENGAVKAEMGENLYEYRFKRRPRDPIVLFCAMCSAHYELQAAEREMGRKWIGVWNDASDRFKRLVTIGEGLSGLT